MSCFNPFEEINLAISNHFSIYDTHNHSFVGRCENREGMIERHGELGFEEVNVMIIEDVWFELKDGRKALLRSPKEEDIE